MPDDGSRPAVGIAPTVGGTTQDVGQPPEPGSGPSTNPLFTQAQAGVPGAVPVHPSEFNFVVAPFGGTTFGTGIVQSDANIGPLALLARPDGTFIASGGGNRGALYAFDEDGGRALAPVAELDQPVFDLAYDKAGGLWATSGGGKLLELDPATLHILNRYGDSLTQSLALDPKLAEPYNALAFLARKQRHFVDARLATDNALARDPERRWQHATALGIETSLYSILTFVSASKTLDFILHGIEEYTAITIVSERSEPIRNAIVSVLGTWPPALYGSSR